MCVELSTTPFFLLLHPPRCITRTSLAGKLVAAQEVLSGSGALQSPERFAVPCVSTRETSSCTKAANLPCQPPPPFSRSTAPRPAPSRRAQWGQRSDTVSYVSSTRFLRRMHRRLPSPGCTIHDTPSETRERLPLSSFPLAFRAQAAATRRVQLGGALPRVLRTGPGERWRRRREAAGTLRGRGLRVRRDAGEAISALPRPFGRGQGRRILRTHAPCLFGAKGSSFPLVLFIALVRPFFPSVCVSVRSSLSARVCTRWERRIMSLPRLTTLFLVQCIQRM